MLKHLSVTNFRNYLRLEMEFPPGLLVLVGGNAQGKTNLVEALYYLSTFVSFQAESDRQLINFLVAHEPLAVARIVAEYQRGLVEHRLEVRLIVENENRHTAPRLRKEVLLDGAKQKLADVVGHFSAVAFLPQSLRIIEGSPDDRRRFLNLAIGQVRPDYTEALVAYTRALQQRNALLKLLAEKGGEADQLDFWDAEMARSGAKIIHARVQAIHELEKLAAPLHRQLTRGKEGLACLYQPAYDPYPTNSSQYRLPVHVSIDREQLSLSQIQEGFLEALQKHRREDLQRGLTTLGPHRDEVRFFSNGLDLTTYGSRGQGRTAVIALKLAELEWVRSKVGFWPLFLLDEVLAELDPSRRQDLLDRLVFYEQAVLTTAEVGLFEPAFLKKATVWQIENGNVLETATAQEE
ncbi:MAG: DNA replication/repair protein RecF [Anaerolineae bacterium]|jgi:DNA replication and repair protein RecF|nr:MAG: DNA replication/repair protein RecF [Anaerolineae bacterium]